MKIFLVVTIDVEPDCSPNWRYSSPLRFEGVKKGIPERLQPLFNKYGIAPTYLINNVVLEDEESCNIFRQLNGNFELGTHLHPEFISPMKLFNDYAGRKGEANCCFLPPEIEFEKIENITRLFSARFGYMPVSFRAGRFSAGSNTILSLGRLGYKVDTSVTPHVKWADKTRELPVDFTNAREQPYFIREGSVLDQSDAGTILQVPVSIILKKTSLIKELKRTYLGTRHPVSSYRPVWLRPAFSTTKELIEVAERYRILYASEKQVVLNMMFHNVEVMPGLSPYSITEKDCATYLKQLEDFFSYCAINSIQGITLRDVYERFR